MGELVTMVGLRLYCAMESAVPSMLEVKAISR